MRFSKEERHIRRYHNRYGEEGEELWRAAGPQVASLDSIRRRRLWSTGRGGGSMGGGQIETQQTRGNDLLQTCPPLSSARPSTSTWTPPLTVSDFYLQLVFPPHHTTNHGHVETLHSFRLFTLL